MEFTHDQLPEQPLPARDPSHAKLDTLLHRMQSSQPPTEEERARARRRRIRNSILFMLFQFGLIGLAFYYVPMRKYIFWVMCIGLVAGVLNFNQDRKKLNGRERTLSLLRLVPAMGGPVALVQPSFAKTALLFAIAASLALYFYELASRSRKSR